MRRAPDRYLTGPPGFGVWLAAGVPGGGTGEPPGCAACRLASERLADCPSWLSGAMRDHFFPRGGGAGQVLLAEGLDDAQVQERLRWRGSMRSEASIWRIARSGWFV